MLERLKTRSLLNIIMSDISIYFKSVYTLRNLLFDKYKYEFKKYNFVDGRSKTEKFFL